MSKSERVRSGTSKKNNKQTQTKNRKNVENSGKWVEKRNNCEETPQNGLYSRCPAGKKELSERKDVRHDGLQTMRNIQSMSLEKKLNQ